MQNVAVKSQDERPEPEDEMRVGTLILILSVLAVALGACDRSKDSAAGVGPIARVLPEGRNGPWLGEMTDAAYRMTNTQDPATIQYYFLDPVPGTEGRRSVSVEIAIESRGEGTRAGLVYGVTANPTTYYFYLLEPDGRVVLFFRESTGALTEVWNSRTNRRAGDFVTLALEENGGQLRLLVDGAQAGMIRSKIGGRGGVGIAAGGDGSVCLREFPARSGTFDPGRAGSRSGSRARESRGSSRSPGGMAPSRDAGGIFIEPSGRLESRLRCARWIRKSLRKQPGDGVRVAGLFPPTTRQSQCVRPACSPGLPPGAGRPLAGGSFRRRERAPDREPERRHDDGRQPALVLQSERVRGLMLRQLRALNSLFRSGGHDSSDFGQLPPDHAGRCEGWRRNPEIPAGCSIYRVAGS